MHVYVGVTKSSRTILQYLMMTDDLFLNRTEWRSTGKAYVQQWTSKGLEMRWMSFLKMCMSIFWKFWISENVVIWQLVQYSLSLTARSLWLLGMYFTNLPLKIRQIILGTRQVDNFNVCMYIVQSRQMWRKRKMGKERKKIIEIDANYCRNCYLYQKNFIISTGVRIMYSLQIKK